MDNDLQQYALSILKAAEPWAATTATRHYKNWCPKKTDYDTPWAARLDAYQSSEVKPYD